MFCVECGSKFPENVKYCSACGAKIEHSSVKGAHMSDSKEDEQLRESIVISNDTAVTDSLENKETQQVDYIASPVAMPQATSLENSEMQQSVYVASPASMPKTDMPQATAQGSTANNQQPFDNNNSYMERKKKKRKIFMVSAIILVISVATGLFFVSFASSYFPGVSFLSNLTNLIGKSVDFERTTINLTYEVGGLAIIFSSASGSIVIDENDSDYNGWSDYITAYDFSGVESLEFDDSDVDYDVHTGLSDNSGEYPNSVIASAIDMYGNVATFSENVSIKEKEYV